jgi:hypothetical protein
VARSRGPGPSRPGVTSPGRAASHGRTPGPGPGEYVSRIGIRSTLAAQARGLPQLRVPRHPRNAASSSDQAQSSIIGKFTPRSGGGRPLRRGPVSDSQAAEPRLRFVLRLRHSAVTEAVTILLVRTGRALQLGNRPGPAASSESAGQLEFCQSFLELPKTIEHHCIFPPN